MLATPCLTAFSGSTPGFPFAIYMTSTDDEARILDFWRRRREGLSEAEWHAFYRLVSPLLMRTQLPADYADRQRRRELVDLFFAEKILLNAETSQAGPLESVHVLHLYLKRFAADLLKYEGRYVPLPETDVAEDEVADEPALGARAARVLAEAGIDAMAASTSAAGFVDSLDEGERAYLRHHSCEDEDTREPVSAIARRLELGSSYHYKARSLGITRSKGDTYAGYEQTRIGRWLLSLGVRLAPDWREEIALLLVLLCAAVDAAPGAQP